METETLFRTLFWILLGGVLMMRVHFSLQVRFAVKRWSPDRAVIQREGRVALAACFLLFFVLLAFLVLYAVGCAVAAPPHPAATVAPLDWLRVGIGQPDLVDLDTSGAGHAMVGAVAASGGTSPGHHRAVCSVRHPAPYTAMVGIAIAFALVTADWVFVAFGIVSTAGLLGRARCEERMMLNRFGAEYEVYMQRTGRLFPRIFSTGIGRR